MSTIRRPPHKDRLRTMIDQLRRDIQHRLDQLLAEAERLRHALSALGSHDRPPSGTAFTTNTGATRPPARARAAGGSGARAGNTATATKRAGSSTTRGAPGATKRAVLAALATGTAMTAGEVATATGLGRASVSTTLSKLAKAGELSKAERGYRLAKSSKQSA
jgi:DNA-binding transcriptional ArsR family regulator